MFRIATRFLRLGVQYSHPGPRLILFPERKYGRIAFPIADQQLSTHYLSDLAGPSLDP
jgi:hypothetical protein